MLNGKFIKVSKGGSIVISPLLIVWLYWDHTSLVQRVSLNELESAYRAALQRCYALKSQADQFPNNKQLEFDAKEACESMRNLKKELCKKAPKRCQ